jgi:hypothetical protein
VPERLDRVQVATRYGIVEISCASRRAIVAQLHCQEMSASAVRAFEAAGASRPVDLDGRGGAAVIDAVNALAEKAGGLGHLEPEVARLQHKLIKQFLAED